MIIRKTPNDSDIYIIVKDNYIVYKLQTKGFIPKYIDENGVYFVKDKEIERIIDKQINVL